MRAVGSSGLVVTEVEFLNRFHRRPNGVWACTKPTKIEVLTDQLSSAKGQALSEEPRLWGSISPRNSIRWQRSIPPVPSLLRVRHYKRGEDSDLVSTSPGVDMYESTEAPNAAVKFEAAKKGSAENSIRSFCKSLLRRIHSGHPGATREHDEVAAAHTPLEACQPMHQPIRRVTKQGRFDWGSFSAFEDGSIEIERAGVRQRFRNFSELKRSLNHSQEDEGSAATGTWQLGAN